VGWPKAPHIKRVLLPRPDFPEFREMRCSVKNRCFPDTSAILSCLPLWSMEIRLRTRSRMLVARPQRLPRRGFRIGSAEPADKRARG
jgi:hypothetical protein